MVENNIKVSVILPSLNVKKYIKQCIDSVVNQTLEDIEIICVDGGSDDGTLDILKNYVDGNRVKLIHSNKKSYGHQVNLGIEASRGEYIGIVETDDYIDETMYETLYDLTNNGHCDIAKVNFFHFQDIEPPKIKPDISKKELPNNKEFTVYQNAKILSGHPSIWAAIYKKSFLNENKIKFLEIAGGGWVDNPFLHQTALSAKSIVYNNQAYYYYRESNPNSSSNNMKDLTISMCRMIDILDILDEYSCHDENILVEVYVRIFYHIAELLRSDLGNQKHDIFIYFKEILCRLDDTIVRKHMSILNKICYHNLLSAYDENSFLFKASIILMKCASIK